ncbi:hypothetical protein K501DRAFT_278063 [Backusella circina FSU 941]|nr:hypothetical protein K501DRAFT_278063 [Backusella circina FSU 941]
MDTFSEVKSIKNSHGPNQVIKVVMELHPHYTTKEEEGILFVVTSINGLIRMAAGLLFRESIAVFVGTILVGTVRFFSWTGNIHGSKVEPGKRAKMVVVFIY